MEDVPRRIQLDKLTTTEKAIYEAGLMIEEMGADVKLTTAQIKLQEARDLVADYVDEQIKNFEKSFSENVSKQ